MIANLSKFSESYKNLQATVHNILDLAGIQVALVHFALLGCQPAKEDLIITNHKDVIIRARIYK